LDSCDDTLRYGTADARLRVVGLKRGGDPLSIIPDERTVIADGDLIVVLGARQSLERLAESANPQAMMTIIAFGIDFDS
jgi:Trk K+ transport system NAD-binding subunit